MNLAAWAERNGVARVTAYRWFRAGLLAVPAQRVGRGILVDGSSAGPAARPALTAVYARVVCHERGEESYVGRTS
jgi:predicted site-specific integrase-resolvase